MIKKIEKLLNLCFSFSATFDFCYYLITPSMYCSKLIFIIETHFTINTLYKLLFMS